MRAAASPRCAACQASARSRGLAGGSVAVAAASSSAGLAGCRA
ncbi:MAG: hypothetical protein U1E53_13940 [Dongiaceae bacterium]